jgi:tight adherence protein B
MVGALFKWIGLLAFGLAVFFFSYHQNKRLLDWLKFQSIGTRDYIVEKLQLMFIEIPPGQILMGQFALAGGLGVGMFLLCLPNFFIAFFFGAILTMVGWKAPKPIVDFFYRRRIKKFVNQMIDGLSLMANGMKSGLSIVQSLSLVTQELPDPIKQEFNLVLNQNKLGVPLEEAFTNLSKRIESDDVEMFVTSINILKETGGNLAETFDTIVVTMRERIKVENKIDALTAQGRTQGFFLCMVPPALLVIFTQIDPEFMRPLMTTTIGMIILGIIFTMEIAAIFVILKITKVDV